MRAYISSLEDPICTQFLNSWRESCPSLFTSRASKKPSQYPSGFLVVLNRVRKSIFYLGILFLDSILLSGCIYSLIKGSKSALFEWEIAELQINRFELQMVCFWLRYVGKISCGHDRLSTIVANPITYAQYKSVLFQAVQSTATSSKNSSGWLFIHNNFRRW